MALIVLAAAFGVYRKHNTVYVTPAGTKYHKANCPRLDGNGSPVDIKKAQELGKEPCKICYDEK